MGNFVKTLRTYKHKHILVVNATLLIAGLIAAIFLTRSKIFSDLLFELSNLGYLGIFIGGIFFVFTFTAAIASFALVKFIDTMPVILIALIAGFGAVIGDWIIFNLVRNGFRRKIKPDTTKQVIVSAYFRWLAPIAGAILIASPLPDEIGVGLMGITDIKSKKFILLSFVLNFLGIFILLKGISLFN